MVGPGKRPLTQFTSVGPDPCVLPDVPPQLIRSGELPATSLPTTYVGFLPCMASEMSLHVACLVVSLATSLVRTVMDYRNLLDGPPLPLGEPVRKAGGVVGGGGEVQAYPGCKQITAGLGVARLCGVVLGLVLGAVRVLPALLLHFGVVGGVRVRPGLLVGVLQSPGSWRAGVILWLEGRSGLLQSRVVGMVVVVGGGQGGGRRGGRVEGGGGGGGGGVKGGGGGRVARVSGRGVCGGGGGGVERGRVVRPPLHVWSRKSTRPVGRGLHGELAWHPHHCTATEPSAASGRLMVGS